MTEVPESEKIYPHEKCCLCGGDLIIDETTGNDDDDFAYISCENAEHENDGHEQYGAIRIGILRSWGWKIPAWGICRKGLNNFEV